MINWLRQRFARLERRWISDDGQRVRHDEHVRERLSQPLAPEEADPGRDEHETDRGDSDAG